MDTLCMRNCSWSISEAAGTGGDAIDRVLDGVPGVVHKLEDSTGFSGLVVALSVVIIRNEGLRHNLVFWK